MRLHATHIPSGSHLVRLMTGEGVYDRMIVVTELEEGKVLYLAGWIGDPLTPTEWRQAQAEMFPDAEEVRFDRWNPRTQTFRTVSLKLQ